jgi:hypothetical protein
VIISLFSVEVVNVALVAREELRNEAEKGLAAAQMDLARS